MKIIAESYGLTLLQLPQDGLLEPVFRLARQERVSKYMEWNPHRSTADTIAFFDFCAAESESGIGYHFLVRDDKKNQYLGVASLSPMDRPRFRGEVTTWLGPDYFGLGYNKRIKHIIFQYAFEQLGLNKLVFRVTTDNRASVAAHKKLHTVLEGTLRQELFVRGGLTDCFYFGLLKAEYGRYYSELVLKIKD